MYSFIFFLFSIQAHSELVTVDYNFNCTAKIDTKVISLAEYNAINRLWTPVGMMLWGDIEFDSALQSAQDVPKVIRNKKKTIAEDFKKQEAQLLGLQTPNLPIWKNTRDRALKRLRISFAEVNAMLDYLLTGETAGLIQPMPGLKMPDRCQRFLQPLKNMESLKAFAPSFAKESCEKNAFKEKCLNSLALDPKSANSVANLKFHILSLGLSNCSQFYSNDIWTDREAKELTKLVRDIECEAP